VTSQQVWQIGLIQASWPSQWKYLKDNYRRLPTVWVNKSVIRSVSQSVGQSVRFSGLSVSAYAPVYITCPQHNTYNHVKVFCL